jgi:hypothetical protein
MDSSMNEFLSRDSSPGVQEWDKEVAEVLAQGVISGAKNWSDYS